MLQLPPRPVQESLAVIGEESFELLGVVYLDAYGLRLAGNIEVDERQLNLLQGPCAAQKSAVDPQLRPMQGTMALGNSLQAPRWVLNSSSRFDGCVVTIGTAAYASARRSRSRARSLPHSLAHGGVRARHDLRYPRGHWERA